MDPSRPARDRLRLFRDLTAELPLGPWLASLEEDDSWAVVAGRPGSVVADGLDVETADSISSASAFFPPALVHWDRALDAAEALAQIALEAGADPGQVAEALSFSHPDNPDFVAALEKRLRKMGGVRPGETVDEAFQRIFGDS
jgi:hypothetical protein